MNEQASQEASVLQTKTSRELVELQTNTALQLLNSAQELYTNVDNRPANLKLFNKRSEITQLFWESNAVNAHIADRLAVNVMKDALMIIIESRRIEEGVGRNTSLTIMPHRVRMSSTDPIRPIEIDYDVDPRHDFEPPFNDSDLNEKEDDNDQTKTWKWLERNKRQERREIEKREREPKRPEIQESNLLWFDLLFQDAIATHGLSHLITLRRAQE
jgi:hypothetical protein